MALGSDLTRISGGSNVLPDGSTGPVYESAPLESDMYIQGLPRLHVEVSTSTVGGQLYALLEDCNGSDCIHIGHAIMDLRYHEGGEELSSTWTPVLGTITAMMEFIALDAEIAAGNTIRLTLLSTGEDYLPASTSSIVTIQDGEGSTLQLDTYENSDNPNVNRRYFTPPACTHDICE